MWAFISDYFLSNSSYDLPFFRPYLYYFLLLFIMDEYIIEIIMFTLSIFIIFLIIIYNYSLLINYDDLLFYTRRMTASLVSSGDSKTAVNSNTLSDQWAVFISWWLLHIIKHQHQEQRNAAITVLASIKVLSQHRITHNERHSKNKKYC